MGQYFVALNITMCMLAYKVGERKATRKRNEYRAMETGDGLDDRFIITK